MLRQTLLYLSNQPKIFNLVRRNGFAKRMAARFVPGETLEDAIDAVAGLNALQITASLDLLGKVSIPRRMRARRVRSTCAL